MSEYNMTHTGRELDDAINKVKSGYVLPTEIYNIYSNVSDLDITMGKTLNVDIQPSGDYVKLNKYFYEKYSPSGSSSLVKSKTFSCGFLPKIVLIVPNTDTTFSTTNTNIFSAYIAIGSFELRREGIYKLSTNNRVGVSSGGLSVSATGFTYSHDKIEFIVGSDYDVYAWGEA